MAYYSIEGIEPKFCEKCGAELFRTFTEHTTDLGYDVFTGSKKTYTECTNIRECPKRKYYPFFGWNDHDKWTSRGTTAYGIKWEKQYA